MLVNCSLAFRVGETHSLTLLQPGLDTQDNFFLDPLEAEQEGPGESVQATGPGDHGFSNGLHREQRRRGVREVKGHGLVR